MKLIKNLLTTCILSCCGAIAVPAAQAGIFGQGYNTTSIRVLLQAQAPAPDPEKAAHPYPPKKGQPGPKPQPKPQHKPQPKPQHMPQPKPQPKPEPKPQP